MALCRAETILVAGAVHDTTPNIRLLGNIESTTEIMNGRIQISLRSILCKAIRGFGGKKPVFQSKQWDNGLIQFTVDLQAPGTGRDMMLKDFSVDGLALPHAEDAENSCAGTALIHLDTEFNVEVVDVSILKYERLESRYRTMVRHMGDVYHYVEKGEAIWSSNAYEAEKLCVLYESEVRKTILHGMDTTALTTLHEILTDIRHTRSVAGAHRSSLQGEIKILAEEPKNNRFTAIKSRAFKNHKAWRRVVKIPVKGIVGEVAKKLGFAEPVFRSYEVSEGLFETEVKLLSAPNVSSHKKFMLVFVGREMETKGEAEENAGLGVITFLEDHMGFQVSDLHHDARVIAECNLAFTDELRKRVYSAGAEVMDGLTYLFTTLNRVCEAYENKSLGLYDGITSGSKYEIAGQFVKSIRSLIEASTADFKHVHLRLQKAISPEAAN